MELGVAIRSLMLLQNSGIDSHRRILAMPMFAPEARLMALYHSILLFSSTITMVSVRDLVLTGKLSGEGAGRTLVAAEGSSFVIDLDLLHPTVV